MARPGTTIEPLDDDGFSLVEIVVSMLLLALLALSFLPLVIRSLTTSSSSTTLATATRLVSEQMEIVRATTGSCTAFTNAGLGTELAREFTDPRGIDLEVHTVMEACPGDGGVFRYTVTVIDAASSSPALAEATTLVAVEPT